MRRRALHRMARGWAPAFGLALATVVGRPAAAETSCFSPEEARQQVTRHDLVPLHEVVRAARGGGQAELISARLCETGGNMVYMVTMLARDGKVARLTLDARTGELINTR